MGNIQFAHNHKVSASSDKFGKVIRLLFIMVLLSMSLAATPIQPVQTEPASPSTAAWNPLSNKGLNFLISAMAVSGDDLYVGGDFFETGDGTVTGLNNITRYDTTTGTWHALPNQGLDGTVGALAVSGDDLFVGGKFQKTFDGSVTDLNNIARFDTNTGTWHALPNKGLNEPVESLTQSGDDLFVGGDFQKTFDGSVTDLNNIARFDTNTGTWHALPNKGLNESVEAVAASGNNLYFGGYFMETGDGWFILGVVARYMDSIPAWIPMPNQGFSRVRANLVSALAVSGEDLYVGGLLDQTTDGMLTDLGNIVRYDSTTTGTWHAMPNKGLNGRVSALLVSGDYLFVGGASAELATGY
jgi:N-acetylneuraminic acid mutarotase